MDESRICTEVVKNGEMCGKRRKNRRKKKRHINVWGPETGAADRKKSDSLEWDMVLTA